MHWELWTRCRTWTTFWCYRIKSQKRNLETKTTLLIFLISHSQKVCLRTVLNGSPRSPQSQVPCPHFYTFQWPKKALSWAELGRCLGVNHSHLIKRTLAGILNSWLSRHKCNVKKTTTCQKVQEMISLNPLKYAANFLFLNHPEAAPKPS